MHQPFSTMAPTGQGNSGDFDFSLCKAQVYGQAYTWHCREHFYGHSPAKSPAQIPAGKCEITPAILGMDSKAPQFHGSAGVIQSSKHGT